MAHMTGNTSFYVIRKQNTFGTFPTTASNLVLGQNITMELVPNILDRPIHTGQIFDTTCNSVFASSEASIKFDGALSIDYLPFFESWFGTTITNETNIQVNPTGSVSLTIMQLNSQNPTKCRYATGCTVKSINITAAPKDYIKMTVELVGKSLSDWTTRPSISGSYPTGPTCHNPIMFSEFRHSNFSNISNYSMTLDTEFVQDSVRYSNNFNPVNNIYVKKMATQTIEYAFDPTSTDIIQSEINTLLGTADITFDDLSILSEELITSYTRPDPANGVWKSTINTKLVYHDSTGPVIWAELP